MWHKKALHVQSGVSELNPWVFGMQGQAVKAGMMIARGEQLLMADADNATRISDLAKLEAALKQLNTPGDCTALHALASPFLCSRLALCLSHCYHACLSLPYL